MNPTSCPSCGTAAAGAYCSACGTAVRAGCRACETPLAPGARFCNGCGAPAGAAPPPAAKADAASGVSPTASRAPWFIAGAAVAALAAVLLVPRLGGSGGEAAQAGAFVPAPQGASAVDLSSMTPREAADRLFNRVMESVSQGDTAQALTFLPMALQAYAVVQESDADLHYHVGELHLVNGDPAAARASADAILAEQPSHLFGLFTGARARLALGDAEEADVLFRRFVEVYTAEVARDLVEYRDHAQALPVMRAEAERAVGGG